MASYCEVCQQGFTATPHTHSLSPLIGSRGRSPLRTEARPSLPSPGRAARLTSPYRSSQPPSRKPSPYDGEKEQAAPLAHPSASSRRYVRGTYSSERRRSETSSPVRSGLDGGTYLEYSRSKPNNSNNAVNTGGHVRQPQSTSEALAQALQQMRAAPPPQHTSSSRRIDEADDRRQRRHHSRHRSTSPLSPPRDARELSSHQAGLYRYTHEYLPSRFPNHHSHAPAHDRFEESAPQCVQDGAMDELAGASLHGASSHPYEAHATPLTPGGKGGTALSGASPSFRIPHSNDFGLPSAPASNTTSASTNPDEGVGDEEKPYDVARLPRSPEADRLRARQARLKEREWQHALSARVEELRRGFVQLCAAVKEDMRVLESRCLGGTEPCTPAHLASLTRGALPPRRPEGSLSADRSPASCDRPTRESSPLTTGTDEDAAPHRCGPSSLPALVNLVRAASDTERQALAHVLWEDMKPLLHKEMQRGREKDQRRLEASLQESHKRLAAQLKTELRQEYDAAAATAVAMSSTPAITSDFVRGLLPIDFSSPESLEAHLRAVARQVLAEEDEQRMGMASYNERRHQEAMNHQQQLWCTELKRAEREWRREYAEAIAAERKTWLRQDKQELHHELDGMQRLVEAVTHDVADLTHRVRDAQDRQAAWIEAESKQRAQDTRKADSTLTARVAAAVREHMQTQTQSASLPASPQPAHTFAAGMSTARTGTSVDVFTSNDSVRMDVVQPAMEHVKRLLAAHQKVIDATVERRCALAEQSVSERQHVWEQHVTELRSKVSSLRTDVRSAFSEVCEKLNMAAPGL